MTTEIEFELTPQQFAAMGYPQLNPGDLLTVTLDAGVLLPDPAADAWFTVRKEPFPALYKSVPGGMAVFSGQIQQAEVGWAGESESAALLIDCGFPLRATCAPGEDGRLPYGTWETRYLTGFGRLYGIVEDDFATAVGKTVDLTIWGFRRLVLTPGDPLIGEWHESEVLPPAPFYYDRVLVKAHFQRETLHRLSR
jgi:hypothetical protein